MRRLPSANRVPGLSLRRVASLFVVRQGLFGYSGSRDLARPDINSRFNQSRSLCWDHAVDGDAGVELWAMEVVTFHRSNRLTLSKSYTSMVCQTFKIDRLVDAGLDYKHMWQGLERIISSSNRTNSDDINNTFPTVVRRRDNQKGQANE